MNSFKRLEVAFSPASSAATLVPFCPDAPMDLGLPCQQAPTKEIHALSSIKPHVLALALLVSSGLWCGLGWTAYHVAVWLAR